VWHLLASLLLLPDRINPVLDVAWTLRSEMMFYALFALAIASRRFGACVLVAWLALILAGQFVTTDHPVLWVLMSAFNLELLLGVAVARTTLGFALPRPKLLIALGALAFLVAGVAENAGLMPRAGDVGTLLFDSASAAMIAGLATAERQGRLHVGRLGAFVGDMSYSLYLIHTVAIGLAARVLAVTGLVKLLPIGIVFAIVVLTAVAAGAGLHVLVERPLLRWLGRIGRVRRLDHMKRVPTP
jgi:peptidoglycan/LPS O-acetylase OafA/YrhL